MHYIAGRKGVGLHITPIWYSGIVIAVAVLCVNSGRLLKSWGVDPMVVVVQ